MASKSLIYIINTLPKYFCVYNLYVFCPLVDNTRPIRWPFNIYIYIYQTLLSKATYIAFKLQFYILSALAFPGNRTHDLGVASAMLYHLSYRKAVYQ